MSQVSRGLKFRAWDKSIKKMWLWNDLQYTFMQSLKHYPVMQYTGLKDKNGREIYEGDIVNGEEYWGKNTPISWGFHEDHSSYKSQLGWNIWEDGVNKDVAMEVQVIGNIYENPELVK